MIIQVDQEGMNTISQLCDIALKSAGMQNLNPVNMILRSVKILPTPEEILAKANTLPKSLEKKDETACGTDAEKQKEEVKEEAKKEVVESIKPELLKEEEVAEEAVEEVKEG